MAAQMGGYVLLELGQDVHGEIPGFFEMIEGIAPSIQAEQKQRRLERDGTEGIGGESDRRTATGHGRDDGDAGRKGSQRAAVVEYFPDGGHAIAPVIFA